MTPRNVGQSVNTNQHLNANALRSNTAGWTLVGAVCQKMRQSATRIDVIATNARATLTSAWFTVLLLTPTDAKAASLCCFLLQLCCFMSTRACLCRRNSCAADRNDWPIDRVWCSVVPEVVQRFNDWLAGVVFVVEN